MRIKSLLFAGTLALASLTMVYAKSYDISLSGPVQAGNVQLKAGQYTLKIKGSSAVFTDLEDGKSYTAPVKVDQGTQKFDVTAVQTDTKGATTQIKSIELGGSTTTLKFGD
jgi:hypothetical protein